MGARDDRFQVDARHSGGRFVVTPRGDLDIATVGRVRGLLTHRRSGEPLELDLSRLRFLDTSGLQLVVEIHREAVEQGYEMRILPGRQQVHRVFELSGLDRVLPFVDDGAG